MTYAVLDCHGDQFNARPYSVHGTVKNVRAAIAGKGSFFALASRQPGNHRVHRGAAVVVGHLVISGKAECATYVSAENAFMVRVISDIFRKFQTKSIIHAPVRPSRNIEEIFPRRTF